MRRPTLWLTTALACALTLARVGPARAAACPGADPCPYAAAHIVGQRAEGVLRFPEAVAVDAQGDVYVADQLSYVVQKFSAAGTFLTEWGSYGGGHGQFGPIGGLATDAAGNVYVLDSAHNRIEKFDSAGGFITTWGHTGNELGQFTFGSSQDPSKPPGGGIAVSGSYVYVADSGNNRIERFALDGSEAFEWGSYGGGGGQFSYPRGVVANAGEVLVADDDNHRIEKFDPNGVFQGAAGTQGTGPGQFGFPYGVTLDAAGNVYVADDINHRIVKLDPALGYLGTWGTFGSAPGQLAFPRALASDPAGDTYVTDTANDRVEVFDTNGVYLRTLGVTAHSLSVLTAPRGVAVDPSGRLLASDTVHDRVELFAPTGAFVTAWGTAGGHGAAFDGAAGIGVDPRGAVYVSEPGSARVARLWGDGTFLSELGGPSDLGGAGLSGPTAVAVAPATGEAYVADTNHNRVLAYGPEGSLLARWGSGGGDGSSGQGQGEFDHPTAVAVGPAGDVYVADRGNDRIVKLTAGGGVLSQWGSEGSGEGRLHGPSGVAVDARGVYVLDSGENRVEVFDPNGRFLAKWGFRGTEPGEFSQPSAIAVGCDGAVYVADTNNNRVERFDPLSPAGVAGCLTPGAWPPPLDVVPTVRVALARHTGVLARRALAMTVSCERGCKVLVTASLTPGGGRRAHAVKLLPAARALPTALTGHVRLRLAPAALTRLRKALGRRRAMTARVSIVAAGPTGRRTTVARTYTVTR